MPNFRPDPEFATKFARIADMTADALMRPAFQRDAEWLREEIAGLEEEDIPDLEAEVIRLQQEYADLPLQIAKKQLDLAQAKIKLLEKKAKLGGAQ